MKSADGSARFAVLLRGVRVGTEQVDVTHAGGGLKISATGQLAPPFDLLTHKFEMTYTADWQPQQLAIEAVLAGQSIALSTSFGVTTAISEMMRGPQRGSVTHQVSPRAVVLPMNFYAAYEVLAARLGTMPPGTRVPIYIAPDGEITATVDRVTERRVTGPSGPTDLKQYDLTFAQVRGTIAVQVWADSRGRLARIAVPSSQLLVIRDDLASVMVREEKVRNAGDLDVFVPAAGFTLATTVTRPTGATGPRPAVILVGGPGRQDRDEIHYGVPIFGLLAGALADAGYIVVRFDRRGIGQSGGRPEHAGIAEYAQDVVGIVNWLRRQKEVDADRIAVAGHAEGAAIALQAASREKRIRAVALLAAPGTTGREVTLEQQERALASIKDTPAARQAKIDLQRRVIDATISGRGWEGVPADVRQQADTPWFKSWLQFDPASAIRRIEAPILILHGAVDTQMPVAHADRLEVLSSGRDDARPGDTTKTVVPDVNHLLIPAKTGEIEEYEELGKTLAPAVVQALSDWLGKAFGAAR